MELYGFIWQTLLFKGVCFTFQLLLMLDWVLIFLTRAAHTSVNSEGVYEGPLNLGFPELHDYKWVLKRGIFNVILSIKCKISTIFSPSLCFT